MSEPVAQCPCCGYPLVGGPAELHCPDCRQTRRVRDLLPSMRRWSIAARVPIGVGMGVSAFTTRTWLGVVVHNPDPVNFGFAGFYCLGSLCVFVGMLVAERRQPEPGNLMHRAGWALLCWCVLAAHWALVMSWSGQ